MNEANIPGTSRRVTLEVNFQNVIMHTIINLRNKSALFNTVLQSLKIILLLVRVYPDPSGRPTAT